MQILFFQLSLKKTFRDTPSLIFFIQQNFAMRLTIFVVFCALLMLPLNQEVEARCYTNGCSVPGNLPYFYKRRFTPACNKHDVCYACVRDFYV